MSWWIVNGRRRLAGPYETEDQAWAAHPIVSTQQHQKMLAIARESAWMDHEEMQRRLRRITVVQRAAPRSRRVA